MPVLRVISLIVSNRGTYTSVVIVHPPENTNAQPADVLASWALSYFPLRRLGTRSLPVAPHFMSSYLKSNLSNVGLTCIGTSEPHYRIAPFGSCQWVPRWI